MEKEENKVAAPLEYWKEASELIKKSYRNITSIASRNGTYAHKESVDAVFQYIEVDDNKVGYDIYQYIHSSDTFKTLQTKILGLHKGVFTYLHPHNSRYVYLYGGEADFVIDSKLDRKNNILPSFLLKHYAYTGDGQWSDIDGDDLQRPLFRFYNRLHHQIRDKQVWNHSRIVKFFNFEIKGQHIVKADKVDEAPPPGVVEVERHAPLTYFEIKNQVLVVPSGEIDIKVLASIFIDQRDIIRDQMDNGDPLMACLITPPAVQMRVGSARADQSDIRFEEKKQPSREGHTLRSKSIFTFEDTKTSLEIYFRSDDYEATTATVERPVAIRIAELLVQFGVIDSAGQPTERGGRMRQWLQALKLHEVYNVLFEITTPVKLYQNLYDRYDFETADIATLMTFIWQWVNIRNGPAGYLLKTFEQFQRSMICMIDLRTQYFIRLVTIAGQNVPGNTASVGWIAFPILYASNVYDERKQLKHKVSGLFMGSFRDVDEQGNGYVEQGLMDGIWNETELKYVENPTTKFFKDIITRLKLVIRPLAQIENAEVVHKRIAKEKIDYEANKSTVANIFIRNIAHNLGTHVIPRVENSLLYERFGIALNQLATHRAKESNEQYGQRIDEYFKRIKYINSLKKILEDYLNERQEFISDISPESFPMNTKGYFYRDVVLPFVENMLLTDNLARSEGIGFENVNKNCSLQIRVYRNYGKVMPKTSQHIGYELKAFYTLSDTVYYYPNTNPDEDFPLYIDLPSQSPITYEDFLKDKDIKAVSLADGTLHPDKDVMIALPSHLGRHAFYSILENVIRNSAKNHMDVINGRTYPTPKLTIHISVDDLEFSAQGRAARRRDTFSMDDYYSIRIWDDVTEFTKAEFKEISDWKRSRNIALIYKKEPSGAGRGTADINPEKPADGLTVKQHFFTAFDDRIKHSSPKDGNEDRNVTLGLDDIRVSALILGGGMTKYGERVFSVSEPEHRYLNIGPRVDRKTPYFFYAFRLAKPKSFLFCSTETLENHHESIITVRGVADFKGVAKCDFCLINGEDIKADRFKQLITAHSYTLPNRIIFYNIKTADQQDLLSGLRMSHTPENLQHQRYTDNESDSFERLTKRCWEIWLSRWTVTPRGEEQRVFLTTNDETVSSFRTSFEDMIVWVHSRNPELVRPRSDSLNLFYSRHNRLLTPETRDHLKALDGTCFYQNIDKNSLDFRRLHYLPTTDFEREVLACRLAEAGLFKILVLDERVAKIAVSESEASGALGCSTFEVYKDQNVFICTSLQVKGVEIPMLDHLNRAKGVRLSIAADCSLTLSCNELPLSDRFDAILIHRTKLKQIKDKLGVKEEDIIDALRTYFPLLAINSGGGGKGVLGFKANYFQHTLTMKFFHEKWFPKVAFTEKIIG